MEVKVLSEDKGEMDIEVSNQTVAEVLRMYLNEEGVEFVAWRREHPSKPVVLKIKASSGVKKAVSGAVSAIGKDCSVMLSELKK